MRDDADLKACLHAIATQAYAVSPQLHVPTVTAAMMASLGSPDPELRDTLIYGTIAAWTDTVFTVDELRQLYHTARDAHHLFHGIGDQGTDTVFMRSFSLLVMAVILHHHQTRPVLRREELTGTLVYLDTYLAQERDLRGFTGDTGWAHAAAHAADVLDALAQCAEIEASDLHTMLNLIRTFLCNTATILVDEEDERLAMAVLRIIGRGLVSDAQVTTWLRDLVAGTDHATDQRHVRRINVKHLLRSLYFQVPSTPQAQALLPVIRAVLQQVSPFMAPIT